MTDSVVTCAQCRLKYFGAEGAPCPRCTRGSKHSLSPPAETSPPAPEGKMTPARRDEARRRLLVSREPPEIVIDRLTSQGVPEDEARAVVSELQREIARTLAPAVRQKAIIHLVFASIVGGGGALLLWLAWVGLAAGGRVPVIMLCGGAAGVLTGLGIGGRALVRLITGAVDNHDD